jgi:hypothetical protein
MSRITKKLEADIEELRRKAATRMMTDSNVVQLAARLRDGREVKSEEDFKQWVYEYLDSFSREIGMSWTPIDIFPVWTRVLVEWIGATSGLSTDGDPDNVQALTAAIDELTQCRDGLIPLLDEDENT